MSSELKENQIDKEPVEEKVEVTAAAVDTEEFASEAEETKEIDTRDFELRINDEELARKKKLQEIWDKITTVLLIFLMASPFLILLYIFLSFIFIAGF